MCLHDQDCIVAGCSLFVIVKCHRIDMCFQHRVYKNSKVFDHFVVVDLCMCRTYLILSQSVVELTGCIEGSMTRLLLPYLPSFERLSNGSDLLTGIIECLSGDVDLGRGYQESLLCR